MFSKLNSFFLSSFDNFSEMKKKRSCQCKILKCFHCFVTICQTVDYLTYFFKYFKYVKLTFKQSNKQHRITSLLQLLLHMICGDNFVCSKIRSPKEKKYKTGAEQTETSTVRVLRKAYVF